MNIDMKVQFSQFCDNMLKKQLKGHLSVKLMIV